MLAGPHPPEQARALHAAAAAARRRVRRRSRSPRAAPHHLAGDASSSCSPSRATRVAHPRRRRRDARRAAGRHPRPDGVGQVATWRWRPPRRSPGTEIVAVDAMQVYRRHGHRHRQADARRSGRGAATTASISSMPADDFTVTDFRAALRRGARPIDRPRSPAAARRPAPGCTSRAVIDRLDVPGQWPDVRRRARRASRDGVGAARAGSTTLDPVAAAQDRTDQPPPRRARARGDRSAAAGRSARSVPASTPTRRPTSRRSACAGRARARRRASSSGCTAMMDAGLLAEVGRLARRRAVARRPRQALGYKELLDHLDGAVHARRGGRRDHRCAPASSPCARSGGSVATRAYAGSTSTRRPGRRGWRRS